MIRTQLNRTQRAQCTIHALDKIIGRRTTELVHVNPYELLVATVLSAQCTDERVNQVTPPLFNAFPTVAQMAEATAEELFPFIKSVTYPNSKSRHLVGLSRMIVSEYGGEVPRSVKTLIRLPGVGQKTAQVVAAAAFGAQTLAVDTHVFRVSHRIGLVKTDAKTPGKVEKQLKRLVPRDMWSDLHHLLIFHGRTTCRSRSPQCEECPVAGCCNYSANLKKLPTRLNGLVPELGRYYCATRRQYFNQPDRITDRTGTLQISCPRCGSMNVFHAKTGETTRRIKDYRI